MKASRKRTIRRRPPGQAPALSGVHPVLQRVYAARQVTSPEELDTGLQALPRPQGLRGLEQAVELLAEAVSHGRRILVLGDFDADGATSTALAVRALRTMGAADVHYRVPDRFRYGYGLSPEIVEAIAPLQPELLMTVDNGVAAVAGVEAAQARGMKVVVTDHHLPGEQLPPADAMVNPNLAGDAFPGKHLAGVGVTFYVMLALRAHLQAQGWFEGREQPNMARFLDLVALGTVADVVPLDRINRILVAQGLRRIRAGQCVPGILSLAAIAGRDPARLVAADLGYALAPRLNAAGRLEDMAIGIECLLSDDPADSRRRAETLDKLNRERREIEQEMQQQALEELRALQERLVTADLPKGLCLFDARWHQGVIGILASRIKERLHRPVIAFAADGEGMVKGSARSVSGVHIRDVLERVDALHPGLIRQFGGHAMAAGLSLARDNLAAFRQAFEEVLEDWVDEAMLAGEVLTDGELAPPELTMDVAQALREGGPWGAGFPEPLFDGVFKVLDQRALSGGKHLKLSLTPAAGGPTLDAIAFNVDEAWVQQRPQRLQAAYRLDINEFRGRRSLQLVLDYMESA